MKHQFGIIFFVCVLSSTSLVAQISPPGLGIAHTADWVAFAIRHKLDSVNKKQWVSYVGLGRISNPDDYNPVEKSAIVVVNQEFYNQFLEHWQYSLALSYRHQNEYKSTPPYHEDVPNAKQEFRIYGRYSYIWKNLRLKLATTFRQEFRKFYTPDFKDWEESMQFRTRLRTHLTVNLDKRKVHRLVTSAEALFAIGKVTDAEKQWTDFDYRESRFCFYYSVTPPRSAFTFDFGYMNNLIGRHSVTDVHYLAIDVMWQIPYKNRG